jgi:DNA-binding NtrC family response regulator
MTNPPTHRLLLVDDEPAVLEALTTALARTRDLHLRFETAASGREALEKIARDRFDLVIADHRMPGMSGVELLERVRERSPDSVRVLLTVMSDADVAMQAMERARVHYYMRKPWTNDELRGLVTEALERRNPNGRAPKYS